MLWMWGFVVHLQAVVAPFSSQDAMPEPKHVTVQLLSIKNNECWRESNVESLVVESGFYNEGAFVIYLLQAKVQEYNLCYHVSIMLEEMVANAGYFEINHGKLYGYTNVIISSQQTIFNSGKMLFNMSGFYLALAVDLDIFVPAVFDIMLVASKLVTNTGMILVKSRQNHPLLMGIVRREGTHAHFSNLGVICLVHASLIQQMAIKAGGCIVLLHTSWFVVDASYAVDAGTLVYCTATPRPSTIVFQYLEDGSPTVTRFSVAAFGTRCLLKVRPPLGQFTFSGNYLKFRDQKGRLRLEINVGKGYTSLRFKFSPGLAEYPLSKQAFQPALCRCF